LSSLAKKDNALFYRDSVQAIEKALNGNNFLIAERTARKLHEAFPTDAKANLLLAQVLVAKDAYPAALEFAERADSLAHSHPGTNYFLGRIYLRLGLFEKAMPLFTESLKKLPDSVLVNWAMADMHMALNKGDQAIVYYQKALAIPAEPAIHMQVRSNYASALSTIDRHQEASTQLELLKDLPGYRTIHLSKKSFDPKCEDWPKLEEELKAVLQEPQIADDERSVLIHALGNVADRLKRSDEAFLYWQSARNLMGVSFEIDAFVSTVDNLIKFYSKDFIKSLVPFGDLSERPVFIFGMARSGTTLAEQILAAHRDGFGVGELGRMSKLEQDFFNRYCENPNYDKALRNSKAGGLKADAQNYLHLLSHIAPESALRVVDKAVAQIMATGFTHACFPNAKFIHCDRHPADSFVSAFQNRLDHGYVSNQADYAKYYLGKQKLLAHWKTCFPEHIFEINYEKLVKDPEPMVRDLLVFLGIEWDPNCMRFFEQKTTVQTLSFRQVRQPIYTSSVYRWTKYEKHLGPLFDALKAANFTYPEF
jgi:tetratricopeptide (TPR) repeat protein